MKKTTPETLEYWHHHIRSYEESDLSVRRYCTTHNLVDSTFRYWQKKLTHVAPKAESFIQVKVKDIASGCRLRLSSGICLELDHLPNPSWLASLEKELYAS